MISSKWSEVERPLLLPFQTSAVMNKIFGTKAESVDMSMVFEQLFEELQSSGRDLDSSLQNVSEALLEFRESTDCKAMGIAYHWQRALEEEKGIPVCRKDLKALAAAINPNLAGDDAQLVVDKSADLKEPLSLDALSQELLPCVQTDEDFALVAKHIEERIVQCGGMTTAAQGDLSLEEQPDSIAFEAQQEAKAAVEKFDAAEDAYLCGVTAILAKLRVLRDEGLLYWSRTRAVFYSFLQRDTTLQNSALCLQSEFNAFPRDCRLHPEMKAELFMKVEDLAHEELKRTEERGEEAEAELKRVLGGEGWARAQKDRIAMLLLALCRCELAHLRHISTILKLDLFKPDQDLTSFIVDKHKEGTGRALAATMEQLKKITVPEEQLHQAFQSRICQIEHQATSLLEDVDTRSEHQIQRMEAWRTERLEAERLAVERFCQFAKGRAEAGQDLDLYESAPRQR